MNSHRSSWGNEVASQNEVASWNEISILRITFQPTSGVIVSRLPRLTYELGRRLLLEESLGLCRLVFRRSFAGLLGELAPSQFDFESPKKIVSFPDNWC